MTIPEINSRTTFYRKQGIRLGIICLLSSAVIVFLFFVAHLVADKSGEEHFLQNYDNQTLETFPNGTSNELAKRSTLRVSFLFVFLKILMDNF